MEAVETTDRELIAALLRRNTPARAYELGDLDDAEWPHTRWYGWEADGRLEEVVLLYTRPQVPVLLAVAPRDPTPGAALLASILDQLPAPLYVHVSPALLDVLARRYTVEHAEPHLKLALATTSRIAEEAAEVELLGPPAVDEVLAFYAEAYPGTWFEPHQLETRRYVGIRRDGMLACVAGVHVYAPSLGVAALGNVATRPAWRGQGLARGACAALCQLLREDGIETIALNVRADNASALRAYERLGFEPVAEYVEASLAAPPDGRPPRAAPTQPTSGGIRTHTGSRGRPRSAPTAGDPSAGGAGAGRAPSTRSGPRSRGTGRAARERRDRPDGVA